MNEPTWNEQYSARFKFLSSRDVEVWEEIVFQTIHNTRPGEVLKAVITLGEDKQKGKYAKYPPTVEDLMAAIKKNRWKERIAREGSGPRPDECALCADFGWMIYGASVRGHKTLDGERVISFGVGRQVSDGWFFYTFAVPCLCSLGDREIKVYPTSQHEKIIGLAHKVMDWKKTLTELSCAADRRFAVNEG